jgi:hypothetical protein
MNERIKLLAEKATQEFSYAFERDKWMEKFAELLIQECLFIIDDEREPDMVSRTELWKQIKNTEQLLGWKWRDAE